jgi:hypothetical protein
MSLLYNLNNSLKLLAISCLSNVLVTKKKTISDSHRLNTVSCNIEINNICIIVMMILYIYDVLLHITLIFFILSMFFSFILKESIQNKFDEKTEIIKSIIQYPDVKAQRDNHNHMWMKKIVVINIILIATTVVFTIVSTFFASGYDVLKIFTSNVFNSIAVILIQIFLFNQLNNFSSLSPIDFEVAILNSLDDLLNTV